MYWLYHIYIPFPYSFILLACLYNIFELSCRPEWEIEMIVGVTVVQTQTGRGGGRQWLGPLESYGKEASRLD